MSRMRLSPTRRLALFVEAGGRCAACQTRIGPGQRWDLDHVVPLAEGGPDDEANLQVLCRVCHGSKTRQQVTAAARAERMKLRHLGAWRARSPLPGGKASRWKRALDGTVTRRGGPERS